MTTRAEIVECARSWLKTPYVHQARLKYVGVDCVGLPICVAREMNVVSPDFDIARYDRNPDGSILVLAREHLIEIPFKDARPADIVVIGMVGTPRHFCILADYRHGGLSIIHAYGKGVIETRLLQTTSFRVVAAFSIPGIED